MYYNQAIKLPDLLGSGVYMGGSLEAGRVQNRFDGRPDHNTKYSASVFLAADTCGARLPRLQAGAERALEHLLGAGRALNARPEP